MVRVLYLAGGYPSKENPTHGVFNERAAHNLKRLVHLSVVQYRFWKPGRRILSVINDDGFTRYTLCVPCVPVFQRTLFWLNDFLFAFVTWIFLGAELKRANVVHASDGNLAVFASRLRRFYNFKLLAQFIGGDLNQDLAYQSGTLISKRWIDELDAVSFNSEGLRGRFHDLFGCHPREFVVYRGVDLLRFSPRSTQRVLNPIRFYFLGGLPKYSTFRHGRNTKGGYTLMKAWSTLDSREVADAAELHLAGPDSDIDEVWEWRASLRKPELVHVHGPISRMDMPSFHQSNDVLLLPSLEEGMPNVVMEACATANLVIATRVGGVPEVLVDSVNGLLVPPGDVEALVKAMILVLHEPALVDRLGQAARERVKSGFNCRAFGERYLSIYNNLVNNEGIDDTGHSP